LVYRQESLANDAAVSKVKQLNYAQLTLSGKTQTLCQGVTQRPIEASGFSLVSREFTRHVLAQPKESWLLTHELAHEWWGNAISACSWSDFWFNDGIEKKINKIRVNQRTQQFQFNSS
jgi:hypothetical protein